MNAQQVIEEHPPFINVYNPVCGWKAQMFTWDPDFGGKGVGGYDVFQTGMFPVATKELAIVQAMDWCLSDEIEYKGPEPQEQATKDAIAEMKAAYADMG